MLSINLYVGDVVLEHGGDIDLQLCVSMRIPGCGGCGLAVSTTRAGGAVIGSRPRRRGAEGSTDFREGALGEDSARPGGLAHTMEEAAAHEGTTGSTYMSRQVFPHAPSPTMTSLRRSSAIVGVLDVRARGAGWRIRRRVMGA
jgi:hypothetical protein